MKSLFTPPKSSVDWRAAGDAARDRKEWREAARFYLSHLADHPRDFGIWIQRGHAEKESGDFHAALGCYLEARRLNGEDADLWLQLGHLYKLMSRETEAVDAYRASLRINPDLEDASREVASLMRVAEAPPATPAAFEEPAAPILGPPDAKITMQQIADDGALRRHIDEARTGGDLIAAAVLTRALLRLAPGDAARWLALAEALLILGDETQAARCEAVARAIGDTSRRQM